MSANRTVYHWILARLLKERGPDGFQIIPELRLSEEPQRADFLVVRRVRSRGRRKARLLRKLWPLLPRTTIIEYKSPVHALRTGDLARLLGYGAQYHAAEPQRVTQVRDLMLVLVVATKTRALARELAAFAWPKTALGGGYYRLQSQPYPALLVIVDEVTLSERDDLLDIVGRSTMGTARAKRWLSQHKGAAMKSDRMQDMEGFDKLESKWLAEIPVEKRLKGIPAVAMLLALDDDMLRELTSAFLRKLSPSARAKIKRRLAAR